ncbi:MAG: anti-sigma factor family protein [Limisphaerales bacterium]
MNHEQQLQLQAYLDGELSDREARQVTDLLASSEEARNLFSELQFTKTALVENEPEFKVPESREFYWSKIQREIRREEIAAARKPEPISFFGWLQRIIVPTASVALVALFATVMINRSSNNEMTSPMAMQFGEVESALDDIGTMTFRSEAERMTVVWVYSRGNSDVAMDQSTFNSFE